ncbi:Glycerol kinase [bioreactor metagenome]|uniref:glycerol kinase n=1 Tax=bioreactor metagenome TaxID=1076179 RepID=A0A645BXX8_9ZZZZ
MIREKTGLVPDAYFSGTKLQWLLDHLNLRERARKGELCFGTVDSYLAWHLVKGHPHVTDATNAGRTMLFNLARQQWDDELLDIMDIPREVLPTVVDTARIVGMLDEDILGAPIPVASLVGDQHAALFGQACINKGMAKNTYGTGCFMLMNIGNEFRLSQAGLLTTMAWRLDGKPTYAFEGSVFMGGAAIQWLRDEMKLIKSAADSEALARSVPTSGDCYLVPAFTGLGAPYWDMYARGTMVGLTRGTTRAHFARAVLESIAYQTKDLIDAMERDSGVRLTELRVDGGAAVSDILMQFQADMLGARIDRPASVETTALGAAYLAGLCTGYWKDKAEIAAKRRSARLFEPSMDARERDKLYHDWKRAVERAKRWIE